MATDPLRISGLAPFRTPVFPAANTQTPPPTQRAALIPFLGTNIHLGAVFTLDVLISPGGQC